MYRQQEAFDELCARLEDWCVDHPELGIEPMRMEYFAKQVAEHVFEEVLGAVEDEDEEGEP